MSMELFSDVELDLMDMWEAEKQLREHGSAVKSDLGVAEILKSLRRVERKLNEIEKMMS